jgi:peptidoglycan hydrolase CwlO-like protein
MNCQHHRSVCGVSLSVGTLSKKLAENLITLGGMMHDRVDAPDSSEVEDALNEYNMVKLELDSKIEELEKEIQQIGNKIRSTQKEKENLVGQMRNIGCYKR